MAPEAVPVGVEGSTAYFGGYLMPVAGQEEGEPTTSAGMKSPSAADPRVT